MLTSSYVYGLQFTVNKIIYKFFGPMARRRTVKLANISAYLPWSS